VDDVGARHREPVGGQRPDDHGEAPTKAALVARAIQDGLIGVDDR
jgi:hypothetical protein